MGMLAGLWRDIGKYSLAFQEYLRASGSCDPTVVEAAQRTDHKSAGAQHAIGTQPTLGHLLAYAIVGHHGGIPDGRSDGTSLEVLLNREIAPWSDGLRHLPEEPDLAPPTHLAHSMGRKDAFVNPFLAEQTGFGNEDLELLWEALRNAFQFDQSAARPPGSMATRKLIVFEHESKLGSVPLHRLFEGVTIQRQNDSVIAREFSDYGVTIDWGTGREGVTVIDMI